MRKDNETDMEKSENMYSGYPTEEWKFSDETWEIFMPDGYRICEVYCCDIDDDSIKESLFNAHLIAAAPDLLAALKGLAEDDLFSTKNMDNALKAIEKAEK